MESTDLFGAVVEFDPAGTAKAYDLLDVRDPSCCDACLQFREIVDRSMLPSSFDAELRRLGINPAKPQEVYGGPGAGFLAGWYLFMGKLHTTWTGETEDAFAEVAPGLRCWVTEHVTTVSWPAPDGRSSLVQVEFDWQAAPSVKTGLELVRE